MAKETVLITGASSGIGMGLAKLFAADGSDLVLVARREDRINELAEELKSEHGIEVHVLPKDLSKKTSPKEIFNHLKKEKIEIDVLVNNAGFGSRGTVSELDTDLQVGIDAWAKLPESAKKYVLAIIREADSHSQG